MTVSRAALAGSALVAALALAGCNVDRESATMASTARSAQPLPPQLVSLMTEKGMSPQDPMLVRVFKEESKAEVWKKRKADGRYALLKSYDICRFSGKLGPKIKEGDKQAPEGFYAVTPAHMNPKSSYYLSFNLGFPNAYDRSLGRTGRHVMMHGDCLSAGCYAMTDEQMGEIYAMARESFRGGQKAFQVQALPFRMTAQNMARRRNDKNMKFWKNLKQGSDAFEVTKLEPKVDACGKKYVFNAETGPLSPIDPNAACPSYTVDPQIAKAVRAKEKADEILIAQLSKSEAIAPEYVAQNGRLRRKLSDPVVMVAAVAPEAAGAGLAATPGAQGAAPAPSAQAATTVALSKPVEGEPSKAEGGLFSKMFRDSEPDAAPTAVAAAKPVEGKAAQDGKSADGKNSDGKNSDGKSGEVKIAAAKASAAPVPAARSGGPREASVDQAPVMAAAAPAAPSAASRLKGWVNGLFGQKAEEPAAASPAPAQAVPAGYSVPAQPAKKNRSAGLPDQFAPAQKGGRGVSSAYAAEAE
jgi:murein L,D-transpeptidase YafK